MAIPTVSSPSAWQAVLSLLALCLWLAPLPAAAADAEQQIKAALLYKLPKFMHWPTDSFARSDSPLGICVSGIDPFNGKLEALERRSINGHPIQVHIAHYVKLRPTRCHVVYIPRAEQADMARIIDHFADSATLTIADIEGFAQRGGMVELHRKGGRFGFRIHRGAATALGLTISSTLLQIATDIYD